MEMMTIVTMMIIATMTGIMMDIMTMEMTMMTIVTISFSVVEAATMNTMVNKEKFTGVLEQKHQHQT